MRILFVAMSESIHTARWLKQLEGAGFEVFLFPAIDNASVHKDIENIRICIPLLFFRRFFEAFNFLTGYNISYKIVRIILNKIDKQYYHKRLRKYIKRIRPDIIHSLETQAAGYLVNEVKSAYFRGKKFPVWWHTNWGSDIYLFARLKEHEDRVRDVLKNCNFYSCECQRDADLALQYGLAGKIMPVYPNTGGFSIVELNRIRKMSKPTSERRLIMLKGYQGWAGRALVGLRALARVKDYIQDYRVVVYSNEKGFDVRIAGELFTQETGVEVVFLPNHTSNKEILEYHSRARISIGLSISDAISISVLEAMAMGSFPIQSDTSAAGEWFCHGAGGFLVPPEDPDKIVPFLKEALTNDVLVDTANSFNWRIIQERADAEQLKKLTLKSYNEIYTTIL